MYETQGKQHAHDLSGCVYGFHFVQSNIVYICSITRNFENEIFSLSSPPPWCFSSTMLGNIYVLIIRYFLLYLVFVMLFLLYYSFSEHIGSGEHILQKQILNTNISDFCIFFFFKFTVLKVNIVTV